MGIINQNWFPHVYTHIHTSHVKRYVSRSLCIPRKRRRQRRALPIRTYRFAFFTFIVSKNCRQLLEIPASFPMTRAIPSKCSSHFRGDRSIDGISEQTAVIGRFPRRFRLRFVGEENVREAWRDEQRAAPREAYAHAGKARANWAVVTKEHV